MIDKNTRLSMMVFVLTLTGYIQVSATPVNTSNWTFNLTVTGNTGGAQYVKTVTMGGNTGAADLFDSANDALFPPPPVDPVYDSYFTVPSGTFKNFTKDVKNWIIPYTTSKTWTLKVIGTGDITTTTITWNPAGLPNYGQFLIAGADMRTQSSYAVPGTSDATVAINYNPVVQTLTVNNAPTDGGSVAVDPNYTTVPRNFNLQLTADASSGYRFNGWSGDLTGSTNPSIVVMNASKTISANYIQVWTLTMAANPSGGGSTNPAVGDHTYETYGTIQNITATPASGYRFVNWTGDVADPSAASTTVTVNASKTVTANFIAIRSLTMAVNPGGGGTATPAVGSHDYDDGAVVNITATPSDGYMFVNWTGGAASPNAASTTVTMNANKTVTANFALIRTLAVTVNPGGAGTTNPEGSSPYADGTIVNITATPSPGFAFVNWSGGAADPNAASTTVTMNANKTLTANFISAYRLTIGVNPGGAGATAPAAGVHDYAVGAVVNLAATPAEGYRFANWTGGVTNPNSATTTVAMNANKTITANFIVVRRLNMMVIPSGGGTTSPAIGAYTLDDGTVVTITATPAAGYRFVSWTGGAANPQSATTTVTMNGYKTITAHFAAIRSLTMAVNPGGGGATDPSVGSVNYDDGTVVAITATPAEGYLFANWTGDVTDLNSASTTVTMNVNKTVTANFIAAQRDLLMAVNPTGGGAVTPNAGLNSYGYGAVVEISAAPANGYQFVNWTGDVTDPNAASTTVIMNANKTVTANFSAVQRDLSMAVNPAGGGSVSPGIGLNHYGDGAVVRISATPAIGYQFVSWSGGVTDSNSASTTVIMNANKTITANFGVDTINVETVSKPGTPTGETSAKIGVSYSYCTVGGTSSLEHPIEYRFNWGDGTSSAWQSSATASHDWSTAGAKTVTVDARCQSHTDIISSSDALIVHVKDHDKTGPYLDACYPPAEGKAIPKNSDIQFKIKDDASGVDLGSLLILVNKGIVVFGGSDQTGGKVNIQAKDLQYGIHYDPTDDFSEGSTVDIRIACTDLADPPNQLYATYHFTIGAAEIVETGGDTVDWSGGTVVSEENRIEVLIPENSVIEPVEITIGTVDVETLPELPDTVQGFQLAYHFGPDGFVFNDWVTLKIPYTQLDLNHANVTDALLLPVYYYHTSTGMWEKLAVKNADAGFIYMEIKEFCFLGYGITTTTDAVQETQTAQSLPEVFTLRQNYPNPFNPETKIRFELPRSENVSIRIYGITSKLVRNLVDGYQSAGYHEVVWDGRDDLGKTVTSGIYLFQMNVRGHQFVRKMSFVK